MTSLLGRIAGGAILAAAFAAPLPALAQTSLNNAEIVQGLQGVSTDDPTIKADVLRQMALQSIKQNPGIPQARPSFVAALDKLAQITVQIQFQLNSSIIRPESYQTIGSIADALHNPILLGYKFLIVGNTDATGTREYNLKLSQERADAVMEALVTTFRIPAGQLEAVGLGQEALQDPQHPDAAINRRVQIYNIGGYKRPF